MKFYQLYHLRACDLHLHVKLYQNYHLRLSIYIYMYSSSNCTNYMFAFLHLQLVGKHPYEAFTWEWRNVEMANNSLSGSGAFHSLSEDHWSYVTQGSCGTQGGRPRTKSCNSSLSDSSDLDERCTTFIKPLQSRIHIIYIFTIYVYNCIIYVLTVYMYNCIIYVFTNIWACLEEDVFTFIHSFWRLI